MVPTWQTELLTLLPSQTKVQEPMKEHTTFAIGGPADIWISPRTTAEAALVLQYAHNHHIPITVLGGGSNVLVKDGGIRGIVLQLTELKDTLSCTGTTLVASAGYMMKEVSEYAAAHELTGLEFAVGIPGTLGGAIYMNAGAYDGEISTTVEKVVGLTKTGEPCQYTGADLHFAYRHSIFQETGAIITEIHMTLAKGDKQAIYDKMADLTYRRETKQPLEYPSAGSTFKRPTGNYAGTLIDHTGLKGLTIGGAQVSEKHAGFIINTGTATAKNVLDLIHEVQHRVYEAHQIKLEPEVRIIGDDH